MSNANLALREPQEELWKRADWQRMWLSVWTQNWTSLALVPAGTGAPPDFTLTIAATLARVGMTHLGVPIHVADGTQVRLSHIVPFIEEVRNQQHTGDLILIALPPVRESPVTVSIAQSASNALLCVLLETMTSLEGRETLAKIGKDRFIGSVVFHSEPGKRRK